MSRSETVVDLAPVSRHLLGRRRHDRMAVKHAVECVAGSHTVLGRVLDLSRVGALICLSDIEYQAASDGDLFAVAGRLATLFADGMLLNFGDTKVHAKARIVRVARRAARGPTVIGCEFARPLGFHECAVLRIPPDRMHAPGA